MADILDIGISGLKAQQTALSTTGHNISNAGTEGYNRQTVNFTENTPQVRGGLWVGNGTLVNNIDRIYDQFLTENLRLDTSLFNTSDTLSTHSSQVDRLLADSGTGIQQGLERIFGALQSVVNDPSSLSTRHVLISESNGLVDRFSNIYTQMSEQNKILNSQMGVIAEKVTVIGHSIAELNDQITRAMSISKDNQPNDMLDQRDQLLKDLSKLVSIKTMSQDETSVNVYIGNGHALVTGNKSYDLVAQAATVDPSRLSLFIKKQQLTQEVTSEISGGQLGGLVDFRNQVLEPSINSLGRIAIAVAETVNYQHQLGIDLEGKKGKLFFDDINNDHSIYQRVQGDARNALPHDRILSAHIVDSSSLTTKNYELYFPGPSDNILQIKDSRSGQEILTTVLTGELPQIIELDGIEIHFEAGSFQEGDRFFITPTRNGANEINMTLQRPEAVAIAQAVSTDSAIGNSGNGRISEGRVLDSSTSYFEKEGHLNPPILIRFTSPTSYDVLDNSDPLNPIPLFPPLMDQVYTPGISNNILPLDEGKTAFTSLGGIISTHPIYQAPDSENIVSSTNCFSPCRFVISHYDTSTGLIKQQKPLSTEINASAQEIAYLLSARDGIQATARTTVELSNFQSDNNSFLVLISCSISSPVSWLPVSSILKLP